MAKGSVERGMGEPQLGEAQLGEAQLGEAQLGEAQAGAEILGVAEPSAEAELEEALLLDEGHAGPTWLPEAMYSAARWESG